MKIEAHKIKQLNLIINQYPEKESENIEENSENINKMELLVETLRIIALDKYFEDKSILIPDDCEKHGFVQGSHDLPNFLHFIADMLEE